MAKKDQLTTATPLAYEDYEKLLEKLHRDKNYFLEMYARLSFCTGCRAGDVLKIKWSDIIDSPFATIKEGKTGKIRRISFSKSVQDKIKEMYKLMKPAEVDSYVFENSRTHVPVTIQYINRLLKDAKRRYRIKCENFSTHTFRKTFGRYVYETNNKSAESLILLNKIFKHSSLEITKTYIGITQDQIDSVYSSIQF